MDTTTPPTSDTALDGVRHVLVRVLEIEERLGEIDASTALLGELPELDSLAVMELAAALEDHFDIVIDDEDFTGEVFETVGSLADFVRTEVAARS